MLAYGRRDQDEWQHRRRLVQFWRRQQGSEIHAVFRPIHQEHFQQNSIVISCIYREDKNECFVTSVDAIYLLEALVGVRFTVEEKNRIRRNLEGFRPITVSKTKPGSEDFFKLIMSFPNPKPRNIEKDVKVFPWSIFGPALKKIISKYVSKAVSNPRKILICDSRRATLELYRAPTTQSPTHPLLPMRCPHPYSPLLRPTLITLTLHRTAFLPHRSMRRTTDRNLSTVLPLARTLRLAVIITLLALQDRTHRHNSRDRRHSRLSLAGSIFSPRIRSLSSSTSSCPYPHCIQHIAINCTIVSLLCIHSAPGF
jgi:hypothetical protein